MKIPNDSAIVAHSKLSLARIVSEDSQLQKHPQPPGAKSSKDS